MAQRKGEQIAEYRHENDPPYLYPDYVATRLRAPKKPLVILPRTLSDTTGPAYGRGAVEELDHDLTRQHSREPLGERIIVTGRVLDGDGRPVKSSLVEIWQANAAGRYTHHLDQHPAPLDPNFSVAARCLTNAWGLSLEESRQRLAPGTYTLLALRAGVQEPPHNPDVLPWRPAARARSYLPIRARSEVSTTHDLDVRPRNNTA